MSISHLEWYPDVLRYELQGRYVGRYGCSVSSATNGINDPTKLGLRKTYPADIVAAEPTEWVEWDYDAPWFAMLTKSEGLFLLRRITEVAQSLRGDFSYEWMN